MISGAVNILFLFVGLVGSASGLGGYPADDEAGYQVVVVAHKDADADARILRVPIIGAISENLSPVIGAGGGTVSQVRRALKLAGGDETIKGVILEINSPGGGVTDSDEIWRLIKEFRAEKEKPVMAFFGDVAASGGYYIAAACDKIVARPTTITGSIGVIISTYDVSQALEKLGIKSVNLVSSHTPYKTILSPTRPMTEDERQKIVTIVDEMYQRFVDVVDEGRPRLSRDEVQALANGLIYSANQALDNGLVDMLADANEAYEEMCRMISVEEAQVIEQRRLPDLADILFGARSNHPRNAGESLAAVLYQTTGSKFLYFWQGGR
ncbi:MAG: signal peptide peptidase SppA [Planctomycetota bacterium]|jgi:protease-4